MFQNEIFIKKNIDGPDGTKWKEVGCVIWKVKKLKGLSNSRKTEQYGQKDSYQFKFKIKCKFESHDTHPSWLVARWENLEKGHNNNLSPLQTTEINSLFLWWILWIKKLNVLFECSVEEKTRKKMSSVVRESNQKRTHLEKSFLELYFNSYTCTQIQISFNN